MRVTSVGRMKAVVVPSFGGPDVLRLVDIATPEPHFGEIRVRVAATAINRADLLQCAGFYPAPAGVPSDILGLEFAGTVDKLGEGVVGLALGDRVFALRPTVSPRFQRIFRSNKRQPFQRRF
jgi:NADPH:quinone reductase